MPGEPTPRRNSPPSPRKNHQRSLVLGLEKALRKVADEIGESFTEKRVEPKDALLFMARRMLETDPQSTPKDRTEKEDSIYTVLYHQCQDCGVSSLPTADGPVEIDREVLERVSGDARKVTRS